MEILVGVKYLKFVPLKGFKFNGFRFELFDEGNKRESHFKWTSLKASFS